MTERRVGSGGSRAGMRRQSRNTMPVAATKAKEKKGLNKTKLNGFLR